MTVKALHSELKITQNCNSLLLELVYQLEHNAVSNSQYHRRETLEINPVPSAIQDNVIIFKCRKHRQNVLCNHKNLQSKGSELTQLKFSGKLFVNESLSHENQQLAYKCRKLKSARKIYSTWFYNNCVNIKLSEHSNPVKIFHVRDTENLIGTDNLEFFQLNSYIYFYCCCYLVDVIVGSSRRGCSVEKGVLGDFADFKGERRCRSSFQLSCRPDNLRLSCRDCEVFVRAYFKEHRPATASILL